MLKENIQHIPLYTVEKYGDVQRPLLIIGNAYGIMPYVPRLGLELYKHNFQPFWFAFSGQEGTAGTYSCHQGIKDLELVIARIVSSCKNNRIQILTHCAGSLFTLEYLRRLPDVEHVSSLIIYGLLYSMGRRRKVAERRLKKCRVNYSLSESDWNYDPRPALSSLAIPTLFCHARDPLNLQRATPSEMASAVDATCESHIVWFEQGYDSDLSAIEPFLSVYLKFLNQNYGRNQPYGPRKCK